MESVPQQSMPEPPALDDIAPYDEPMAPSPAWILPIIVCMAMLLLVAVYIRFVRVPAVPVPVATATIETSTPEPVVTHMPERVARVPEPLHAADSRPEPEKEQPATPVTLAETQPKIVNEPPPPTCPQKPAPSDPMKLLAAPPEKHLSAAAREDDDEPERAGPIKKKTLPSANGMDPLAAALNRDAPKKKKRKVTDDGDEVLVDDEAAAMNPPLAVKNDPPVEVAAKPKPVCTRCLGSGFIPTKPPRPYVNLQGGSAPDPVLSVPWGYCPVCHKDGDAKKLIEQEKDRIAIAQKATEEWGKAAGLKFIKAETHHITIFSEMSPGKTRDVANALEAVVAHLQNVTQRTILTSSRPDTHTLYITWGRPSYLKFIDALERSGKFPGENFELSRKAGGSTIKNLAYYNAYAGVPAENVAIFEFSGMQMEAATEGRAPAWLAEGFRSYCENAATGRNLVYSFEYELNEVQLGQNWNADIRTFAQQGKLKTWDKIFGVDLIKMKPIDYLTCYSMVAYLMKSSPESFCKMLLEFRQGTPSEKALEKAYGRRITDLQMAWAQWALQQR